MIGAHAEGFNTGTVGISLIGNFQAAAPSQAMQDALVKLLAWRLDVAHIDPLSTVAYTSGGNAKYKAGKVVTLNAISGHRDTTSTRVPGHDAYKLLPAIAKRVAETGPAEDLRPDGDRRAGRADPLPGAALCEDHVDGHRRRRDGRRGRARVRNGHRRRLDLAGAGEEGGLHVDDQPRRTRCRHPGRSAPGVTAAPTAASDLGVQR